MTGNSTTTLPTTPPVTLAITPTVTHTTLPITDKPGISESNVGLTAAVGIVAAFLAIALGVILYLLWKRRRNNESLVEARRYIESLRGGADPGYVEGKIPLTSTPGPLYQLPANAIDDKFASSLFEGISQEMKDYVANYFNSRHHAPHANDAQVTSDELKAVLDAVAPAGAWRTLLQQSGGKWRMLLVRAAVWGFLGSAWESGELVGCPGINRTDQDDGFRKRREAFLAYIHSPGYAQTQAAATAALTARIDAGLAGLATGGMPAAAERHAALAVIVERAAALAGQLGVQVAEFKLLRTAEGGLNPGVMENVEGGDPQVSASGGERVKMVVAPGLVKWGNARGENWGENLVLVKAKVLLG